MSSLVLSVVLFVGCMPAPPPEPEPEPEPVEEVVEPTLAGVPVLHDSPHYRLVRVGANQACGIYTDGALHCWGDVSVPRLEGPFIDVQIGTGRTLALRENGELVTLSGTVFKTGVTAFSVDGRSQACWIADGTLDCDSTKGKPPKGAEAVGVLARPWGEGCIWDARQTFTCWGPKGVDEPGPPYTAVSGGRSGCGVRENGFVHCWADGSLVKVPSGSFTSVSVERSAACAIRGNGSPACWGLGAPKGTPPGPFVQVDVGVERACGLSADGRVTCWGEDFADHIPYADAPGATGHPKGGASRVKPLRTQAQLDAIDAREGGQHFGGPFGPSDDGLVAVHAEAVTLLAPLGDGVDRHVLEIDVEVLKDVAFVDGAKGESAQMIVIGTKSTSAGVAPDNALIRWTGTHLESVDASEGFETAASLADAKRALAE